ncbi:hypothetical protein LQ567_20095 [Niabella pedocola]|uniref:Beta-lactamase-inhibitor-like PepSY-like domain-containing protein n=1 Tax=Niabella pedocola TaxID=1752077 RepID=A0ABS8PVK7_9BACT|nr:hypothetical protein [Niabella pedocola]MCD2425098.1 hypothetical protein [Niabella pedocola]
MNNIKNLLVLLFFFQGTVLVAQTDDKIRYILPNSVEKYLDSSINIMSGKEYKFYFLFKKDAHFNITMGRYNKTEEKNVLQWVRKTNRFVLINKSIYPLIFDYDLTFAAIDNNIGLFGDRDGNVKKVSLILHGASIYFKADGTIIKMENW